MNDYFKLEGKVAVRCSLEEWGRCFRNKNICRVARTERGDTTISTVFIGLNHRFDESGPPLLFETMVFGGEYDEDMERYSTWEEAEAGHQRPVGA